MEVEVPARAAIAAEEVMGWVGPMGEEPYLEGWARDSVKGSVEVGDSGSWVNCRSSAPGESSVVPVWLRDGGPRDCCPPMMPGPGPPSTGPSRVMGRLAVLLVLPRLGPP